MADLDRSDAVADRAASHEAAGVLARATGALLGLAIGDALGMPTQLMTRAEVVARFGGLLEKLEPAGPEHPVAAGLLAGTVTDDTEQMVLLAQMLVEGHGQVDPAAWARALQDWEADMVRRGSADLLGPSTRRALRAVAAGTPPEEAGVHGDTNGAAMRIAPVGVAVPLTDTDRLVATVVGVSRVTHGTDVALGGAGAVAAAVSAGVSGADVAAATAAAVRVAPLAAAWGRVTDAPRLQDLVTRAVDLVGGLAAADAVDTIVEQVGTGLATTESVPAAFAVLAVHPDDPWAACRLAASLGGDSDTIAAMVGAVAGACSGPAAFPPEVRATVMEINRLPLDALARGLVDLRRRVAPAGDEP